MKRHDPKVYERVSQPHASVDTANDAVTKFFEGIAKLRKRHKIAELLVVAGVYVEGEGQEDVLQVAGFAAGDSRVGATLGAHAYAQYTKPEIDRAERLRKAAQGER